MVVFDHELSPFFQRGIYTIANGYSSMRQRPETENPYRSAEGEEWMPTLAVDRKNITPRLCLDRRVNIHDFTLTQ
jgi:hypothetical protein